MGKVSLSWGGNGFAVLLDIRVVQYSTVVPYSSRNVSYCRCCRRTGRRKEEDGRTGGWEVGSLGGWKDAVTRTRRVELSETRRTNRGFRGWQFSTHSVSVYSLCTVLNLRCRLFLGLSCYAIFTWQLCTL